MNAASTRVSMTIPAEEQQRRGGIFSLVSFVCPRPAILNRAEGGVTSRPIQPSLVHNADQCKDRIHVRVYSRYRDETYERNDTKYSTLGLNM